MSRHPDAPQRSLLHGRESAPPTAAEALDRDLLAQARAGVDRLPAWMFSHPEDRDRLVAALVFEARMGGLARIDEVRPSASGTGVFAVQGQPGDPDHRSVYVDRAAMAKPDEPTGPIQRLRNLLP